MLIRCSSSDMQGGTRDGKTKQKKQKTFETLLYTFTIHFQSFRGSGGYIPKLWLFMSMTFTYLDSKIEGIPQRLLTLSSFSSEQCFLIWEQL